MAAPARARMSYSNQLSHYLENEVRSRPREWLVPLLYEHLLASLHRAAVQIEVGDLAGKANSLNKAISITLELLGSLDFERGGEIATNLSMLYTYLAGEFQIVGRTLDLAHLQKLTGLVSELHEAWVLAAEEVAPRRRAGALAAVPMP